MNIKSDATKRRAEMMLAITDCKLPTTIIVIVLMNNNNKKQQKINKNEQTCIVCLNYYRFDCFVSLMQGSCDCLLHKGNKIIRVHVLWDDKSLEN